MDHSELLGLVGGMYDKLVQDVATRVFQMVEIKLADVVADLAGNVDLGDIAGSFDLADIAGELDVADVAEQLDQSAIIAGLIADGDLAIQVADRLKDHLRVVFVGED